jgi:putative transposase
MVSACQQPIHRANHAAPAATESVNMSLRKQTKNRGSFPSDEALMKLFYLALRNISQKRAMPIRDWKSALTRFTIQFEERIPQM